MRLHEEPFVTAFPLGWRYECVWETGTRQDAELLLKVFRDVCCECAPAGCSGACELVLLPLQTILQVMDAVVEKARYQQKITAISVDTMQMQPPLPPTDLASSSSCCPCSAVSAPRTRVPPPPRPLPRTRRDKRMTPKIYALSATRCTMRKIAVAAGAAPLCPLCFNYNQALNPLSCCSVVPPVRDNYRFAVKCIAAGPSLTYFTTGFWFCAKKLVTAFAL